MEIKQIEPQLVYFNRFEVKLQEIQKYVGATPMDIMKQAEAAGYSILGPQIWNYFGMDGDPEKLFTLDICFPIRNKRKVESKNVKLLDNFQCASDSHIGPWSALKETYKDLSLSMEKQMLIPGNSCREVYHTIDFQEPENCITEIQMEISTN